MQITTIGIILIVMQMLMPMNMKRSMMKYWMNMI